MTHNTENSPRRYMTLAQAANTVPGRPSPSTIHRWIRRGIKARTGEWIRLRCVRIGGRLFVTSEWLVEMFEAVAEADRRAQDAAHDGDAYANSVLADVGDDIDAQLDAEGF